MTITELPKRGTIHHHEHTHGDCNHGQKQDTLLGYEIPSSDYFPVAAENLALNLLRKAKRGRLRSATPQEKSLDTVREELRDIEARLGEQYRETFASLTATQQQAMVSRFTQEREELPVRHPRHIRDDNFHELLHEIQPHHSDGRRHGLGMQLLIRGMSGMLKKIENPKLKMVATKAVMASSLLVCPGDDFAVMGLDVVHSFSRQADSGHQEEQHHESPVRIPEGPRLSVEGRRRREDGDTTYAGTAIVTLPLDRSISPEEVEQLPPQVQQEVRNHLKISEPEQALTWRERRRRKKEVLADVENERRYNNWLQQQVITKTSLAEWARTTLTQKGITIAKTPQESPIQKPRKRKFRTALAAVTAAAAVFAGGGLLNTKAFSTSPEPQWVLPDTATVVPIKPAPPEQATQPSYPLQSETTMTTTVCANKKGDTLWNMVEEQIKKAGKKPTVPVTNALHTLAAADNMTTLPDLKLNVGHCVEMPNQKIITTVFDALTHSSKGELTTNLKILNEQPDVSKQEVVKKETKTLKEISRYLQLEINK